jgi:phosphoribosylaminoimidazolecarboxamide formyltransferase/IMP cyclohydrolase
VNRRRRALLSVTDKTGLTVLARQLVDHGYELIASGGTARHLRDADLTVTEVRELTGFPEIFGGRVKTLHPIIHGGILGKELADFAEVAELGLEPIDVVCVNLYRFDEKVAEADSEDEILEAIDIGGPALLRAAAKNFNRVTVLSDPIFYQDFLKELVGHDGDTSLNFRRRMAAATFARTAVYNRNIAIWLADTLRQEVAEAEPGSGRFITLRYGENPHQQAWLELPPGPLGKPDPANVGLEQLGGKELSYNNLVDLIAAQKLIDDFDEPCCGIIKHTNPCGFGLGEADLALERALKCDPVSAFGGVFAFNSTVDAATAERLGSMFYEIVMAPAFDPEALAQLRKKKNVRILRCDREKFASATSGRSRSFGHIVLHQEEDSGFPELDGWQVAAGPEPDPDLTRALTMAWKVCKHGKSNAVVIGNSAGTLGVGFGQMSRVDSVRIAIRKAADQELDLEGAVAASDGFFPFPDGIEHLAAAGVKAVLAPGGSIRDEEVAQAAARLGITLIFTDRRHFNH